MFIIFIISFVFLSICFVYKCTSLNAVTLFGSLYWIIRDNSSLNIPHVSIGFMRQTSHPWKIGKGLQFRFSNYSVQVGLCRSHNSFKTEEDGLLEALGGRILEEDASTIRNWR